MKAIILSAGRGRRLLPHTESAPKCLLSVDGRATILDVQLRSLAAAGVGRAVVMTGFGADLVDAHLARHAPRGMAVTTRWNAEWEHTDNLVTCWRAAPEMDGPFLLMNGDTLFEASLVGRVLAAPDAPLCVAIDRKASYDDDDMKVTLDGARLRAIGKRLDAGTIHGEAIGFLRASDRGAALLRDALDDAVAQPAARKAWYVSVIHDLAGAGHVETVSIRGERWSEVDSPADLAHARARFVATRRERTERIAPAAIVPAESY
jgi:choline kinase